MNAQVKRVVIVGGGSAGWLVAGILASRFKALEQGGIDVTLIESPDVKI
ncbi:tryptophan 7-halogenase, partial [bacterium]|nr:tryptophan 7-halogenase [bacterium]